MQIIPDMNDCRPGAVLKVVGVGGGGGNAVNGMVSAGILGVDFIAANTDAQSLDASLAPKVVQLGPDLTRGLGAGADPSVGREAAEESRDALAEVLSGTDMVFVTAGMGGGTGTGGAPVVAEVAREMGALCVGVVTRPFLFEGGRKARMAQEGIEQLRDVVDSLITIPNQRLLSVCGDRLSLQDAFAKADEVLLHAVKGISDLINQSGMINVDFADVRTVMSHKGLALMGVGTADGQHKGVEAAQRAISSPLLDEVSIAGATGVLINFTAGPDFSLLEMSEAASLIHEEAAEDANIITGVVIDPNLEGSVTVTVVATGFEHAKPVAVSPPVLTEPRRGRVLRPRPVPMREAPAVQQSLPTATPPREAPWQGVQDLDLPTAVRQKRVAAGSVERLPARESHSVFQEQVDMDLSEFDTPTFLRKSAD
jgi:cell division protein FtsZ